MKIRKCGVIREIDERKWNEYKNKGYEKLKEDVFTETKEENLPYEPLKNEETEETEKSPSTNLENKEVEKIPPKILENEELEKLTVTELKDYANTHNIDLGENTKKADILQILTNRKW